MMPRARMGTWSALAPYGPRGVPSWRASELTVERTDDDLLVHAPDGRVLGSLVHTWNVAFNTHRFELFGTVDHSPRLTVGSVIVQRESWLVSPSEQIRREVEKVGPGQLVGMRRLQRAHRLPQQVFVRPVLSARMSMHKDGKPIFVDFEIPFLAEMLAGVVTKHLQMRMSEIQPRLEDAWVEDAKGRYCSEMRMNALRAR
jgi:hypothetical protein